MAQKKTRRAARIAADPNDITRLYSPLTKITLGGFFLFELIRGLVRLWRVL